MSAQEKTGQQAPWCVPEVRFLKHLVRFYEYLRMERAERPLGIGIALDGGEDIAAQVIGRQL